MTRIYCPFCGNPSTIDHEWFNDATSTINELRVRAEAAEARAEKAEAYIEQDFLKPLYVQRDEAIAIAAELLESNREQAEAITTLRHERENLEHRLNLANTELSAIQGLVHATFIADVAPKVAALIAERDEWKRLYETVDATSHDSAILDDAIEAQLRAQATEQARRLKEAREMIDICAAREEEGNTQNPHMIKRLRAWLASTAPAPQAEQEPE